MPVIYSNPDLSLFLSRRMSQGSLRRRRSLADVIPDFPELDWIEKYEFRVAEVMWTSEIYILYVLLALFKIQHFYLYMKV